jgi:hypothetical protein
MIYVIIASTFVTLFTGMIAGAALHNLTTIENVNLIKQDAQKALQEQANASFAAGYMRGYSDKNAKRPKKIEDDMTLILDLVSH